MLCYFKTKHDFFLNPEIGQVIDCTILDDKVCAL